MNPIAGLLEQHWQELQDLRARYWDHALSTEAADRERLEHAIANIYALHDLAAPQVVWLNSLLDAKMYSALGTYISVPHVNFDMRGPFGRYGGKEGFVTMHTNSDEETHRKLLQSEFPTLYSEEKPEEHLSTLIRKTFLQPCLDGGGLYRALQSSVGVVSTNPFKIILLEAGRVPEGCTMANVITGDMWNEPLPAILNMVDSVLQDRFEQRVDEVDDAEWLTLWERYQFRDEKWRDFGPQFKQMSRERRDEVKLYLSRILALEHVPSFNPIHEAISCARIEALEVMGRGDYYAKLNGFRDAVKAGGWWWPFEGVCFACDNPVEIHLDAQNRLHNEDGMAMHFGDWGFWAVHGVRVPEVVVRNKFSAAEIDAESNAEVRRMMLDRYGISRYVMESGAEEMHKDDFGKLYRKTLPDGQPICLVEVIDKTPEADGSHKKYHLCVPPNVTSAREAVAWTFGLSAQEYDPEQET